MYKMGFADRFKMLRLARGFNQTEFSENFKQVTGVHMTAAAVSNYERGLRVPEVPLLQTMADYFGVSVDFLLGRTAEKKETVPVEDGLKETNVLYKKYSEIFDAYVRRITDEGIIKDGKELTEEHLKLFLSFGLDTAIKILKSKDIDPSVLFRK